MTAGVTLLVSEISQGSEVTCFRCGGIFNNHFVANLQLNVSVKKF